MSPLQASRRPGVAAGTTIVNMRHRTWDVRIDRMTKWGNPFRIGEDGTRDEVIRKYKDWFWANQDLRAVAYDELAGKRLGCWCAPRPCHGDVLKEYVIWEETHRKELQ